MREILFRGKRKENGEWVMGTPFICGNRCKMIQAVAVHPDFVDEGNVYYSEGFPVDLETVGQFTGLTDKKGTKIFEGDIVVICYETDAEVFSETKRVRYNAKECCWYPMRWDECCEHCGHYTEVKSIEVIGNIHDNPELLGGAENGK